MAATRQSLTTKTGPLAKRQEVWQAAVTAAKQHIKLGTTLQAQGVELLKAAQRSDGDSSTLGKLIQQATATITSGTKIERAAHIEIINLHQMEPK